METIQYLRIRKHSFTPERVSAWDVFSFEDLSDSAKDYVIQIVRQNLEVFDGIDADAITREMINLCLDEDQRYDKKGRFCYPDY